MKKRIIKILLMSFLVLGFASQGMALPDKDDFDRPPTKEQREKMRKRIETLRMWRLTKALDLDEDTAAKLFPLLNRYDRRRQKIERDIRDDMAALRDALKDKRRAELRDILEGLEEKHEALQRLNGKERVELKKILTVEQQAKYVLFQQKFNREIRRIIEDAKRRRYERIGKAGPPEGPPPPEEPLPPAE